MNFQEKMFETTADLRTRVAALANATVATARVRAQAAAKRAEVLRGSLAALRIAGRELSKVARRHAVRFVKENSSIAADAGKDVSDLARTTYVTLAKRDSAPRKTRKSATTRRRASSKPS